MPSAVPSHALRLQVTCALPCRPDSPPFEFGVQEGRDTLHPGQTGADGRVTFEAVVTAVQRADGSVRYRGSFVHGPSAEQILYLSVWLVGANPTKWARRVKVRLPALTWTHCGPSMSTNESASGTKVACATPCGGRALRTT